MRFLILMLHIFTVLSFSPTLKAQLILEENFDYELGKLSVVSSNWIDQSDGSYDIDVIEGNLSYDGYLSSGIGRMIELNGGATGRSGIVTSFSSIEGNGSKIYAVFLLNVTSDVELDIESSDGDYFAVFRNENIMRNYIYIKKGTTSGKYKLGLAKSSSNSLKYISDREFDLNTTYILVTCYVFQSGDDLCRLWVDPSLSGSEPSADIEITSGADADSIGSYQFRQEVKSGDMLIDGIRIATDWENAPLPVELSSFTASQEDNLIILNWQTETEIDNYGFNVERKITRFSYLENYCEWETISFITGHGTCNSPKQYVFVDKDVTVSGHYNYRLKQIDFDGTFEYSDEITIHVSAPEQFILNQNYPNPFNPATTISFELPSDSNIKLVIYSMLGERIAILAEGIYAAGKYEIVFEALNFPAGIYLYSCVVGNMFQVRKMLLMK